MPTKFDLSQFTQKARKAMARAQELAANSKHRHVEIEHTMVAMLDQSDSIVETVLKKIDVDTRALGLKLIGELELLPRDYGRGQTQVFVGKDLLAALEDAGEEAKKLGDKFVSTEHLLLAFSRNQKSYTGRVLREMGASVDALRKALAAGHGAQKVAKPEGEVSEILEIGRAHV